MLLIVSLRLDDEPDPDLPSLLLLPLGRSYFPLAGTISIPESLLLPDDRRLITEVSLEVEEEDELEDFGEVDRLESEEEDGDCKECRGFLSEDPEVDPDPEPDLGEEEEEK